MSSLFVSLKSKSFLLNKKMVVKFYYISITHILMNSKTKLILQFSTLMHYEWTMCHLANVLKLRSVSFYQFTDWWAKIQMGNIFVINNFNTQRRIGFLTIQPSRKHREKQWWYLCNYACCPWDTLGDDFVIPCSAGEHVSLCGIFSLCSSISITVKDKPQ